MKNNFKNTKKNKVFKSFIISIIFLIIFIFSFFIYAIATDYQPEEKEVLFKNNFSDTIAQQRFSILSWNIGYCGLGEGMDFFYDGGEKVRASKKVTLHNLKNIINFISKRDTIDFILIQEVDKLSKRSYFINQYNRLNIKLKNHFGVFALNYNVEYVPVPLLSPLGKVKSGMASFSKIKPNISARYSFPGNYTLPKKLFMLDRCFLMNNYKLKNGKSLVVINTHNSAYDKGNLKQKQMQYLRNFVLKEYEKGNYVIVGGDWNQLPPNISVGEYGKSKTNRFVLKKINNNFLPQSWKWIFDKGTATNRSLETKYIKGETHTNIIDFFVISPNIEEIYKTTVNLHFINSDHQPIIASFKLKF